MTVLRILGLLLCIPVLSGFGTGYKVDYDYDRSADFQAFKTFDWMPVPDKEMTSELLLASIKVATEFELEAKGLMKSSTAPDFLIVAHTNVQNEVAVAKWGYAYGPRSNYLGTYWGTGAAPAYSYEEGTLILDFVNPTTKQMIWRGSAKADVDYVDSPDKGWTIIKKAVKAMLGNFPPPVAYDR